MGRASSFNSAFLILMPATLWLILFLSTGCVAKWTMQTETSETQLLWPYSPEKPRIKYIASIKSFEEAGTTFKTFLFGRERTIIKRPSAIAIGHDGRLAIADTGSKCVHLFVPSEQRYRKLTSTGAGELSYPVGVAFDEESRLYVSDSILNLVLVFDRSGAYLHSFNVKGNALKRPTGLAYDREKRVLYVSDTLSHKIYAFDTAGNVVSSFGGRGEETDRFNFPTYLSWSPVGFLYTTDAMNFRIQVFHTGNPGDLAASFGRHGDGSGDFSMPKGIAVDKSGVVYVVDALFDNVQLFNEKGVFLLTMGGRGTGQGEFWLPSGIYIDDNGKIYVCDTYNQRIQIFQILENGNGY